MKFWCLVLLSFALCLSSAVKAQERVGIQPKKVIVPLSPGDDRDFQRSVSYPVLSGIVDKALLKRLQAVVIPRRHGENKDAIAEMKQDNWLNSVTYKVNCNRHSLLHITYEFEGLGAYPDWFYEYIALDLRTGQRIKVKDLFSASTLPQLAAKANRLMQADIRQTMKRVNQHGDKDTQAWIRQLLPKTVFRTTDLTFFTVSPKGVTFHVDFGFPHAIKACQPKGEYFFSLAALKPYIRRDGLLNAFLQ